MPPCGARAVADPAGGGPPQPPAPSPRPPRARRARRGARAGRVEEAVELEEERAAARPGGRRCAAGRGGGQRPGPLRAARWPPPRSEAESVGGRERRVREGDSEGRAREARTSSPFEADDPGEEWRRAGRGGDGKGRNSVPSALDVGFNNDAKSGNSLFEGQRDLRSCN